MKVIQYSYARDPYNGLDYCYYNTYSCSLVVEVSGKRFYAHTKDSTGAPEHYLRRKLEQFILNDIRKELFGN
jgi:hypothetical protein